ncbi:succinic semialdehyde dehydrogenase [Salinibaculum rarum]|uniref:succinic semialdehyde dehydrogenase n=1 Tax=Salinibaculum rarum TaxID=3058903 RepID=UPI00265E9B77|nr:succinic semialdehyde dehydrogenase [Salinibaculum sp. KK48]
MTVSPPPGYDGPSLADLAADVSTDSDETLSVSAPFTGETVGNVPACTPADVRGAAERARETQQSWSDRPVGERAATIERFASLVEDSRGDLLDLIQIESGKARLDAHEEVLDVVATTSYYADRAAEYLTPERKAGVVPLLTSVHKHRDPYGVVGFITPWNYPLTLAVSDALPALLAGNAVLVKPAEETPHTALFVARLLREAGVPEDCFRVLPGEGKRLGEPLVESVDAVSFTGSTAVGREVAAQAGRELVPATLELGGNGPIVVREDAPLGRTVTGAVRGGFASAGQLCIATERIYVHESRYDVFCDRLVERVRNLDLGANFEYSTDVGSLISETQLSKVQSHVDEAVEAGATLLTGGRHRPDVGPLAYEPTVLTDVPDDTAVACEETFGPVVTVTPVEDDEDALARANDDPYGLHGSVWTGDPATGKSVARELDCGTVCVNDAYISMWASTGAPMGGRNDSGIGRRHGDEGFQKYTETQSVAVQRGHPIAPPAGVPNRVVAATLSAYLRLTRAVGLR